VTSIEGGSDEHSFVSTVPRAGSKSETLPSDCAGNPTWSAQLSSIVYRLGYSLVNRTTAGSSANRSQGSARRPQVLVSIRSVRTMHSVEFGHSKSDCDRGAFVTGGTAATNGPNRLQDSECEVIHATHDCMQPAIFCFTRNDGHTLKGPSL
jgi:hypothetical protein